MHKPALPTYFAALLVAAVLLVLSAPSHADALLVPMTLDDLARAADSVVVAQVTGAHPRAVVPGDPKRGIVTDNRLRVGRVIAGDRPTDLTLTQVGGMVDGVGLVAAEQAELRPGMRFVLFLDSENRIVGAEQGALPVTRGRIDGLDITVDELARRVAAARGELPAGATAAPTAGSTLVSRIPAPITVSLTASLEAAASVEASAIDPAAIDAATVIAPASGPVISLVTPSEQYGGVGRSITVKGTGFGSTAGKVYLPSGSSVSGALTTCPIVSWSDSAIVATVPGKVASGWVVVENSAGTRSPDFDYTLSFSADNTNGIKFGSFPITYKVNENTADMTGESTEAKHAFDTWNASGSAFRLAYGGSTTAASVSRDNTNAIYWAHTGTGALATNYYWYDGAGTMVESDIVLNDDYTWRSSAASNVWDVWSTLLHELGHSAGLDDQYSNFDRAMGAGVNGQNRRALSRFEITGAIFVNGPDASTPTAPTVSSATNPSQDTWYASPSATMQFSATAGVGMSGYSYAVDTNAGTTPDATVETAAGSVTLSPGEGECWFHVRGVSAGGVAGPASHYRIRIDTQAPTGSVQIGGASQYVSSTAVSVAANLSDTSGITSMASDAGTGSFSSPVAYAANTSVTLSGSDGSKVVRMRYRDLAGNERTDSRSLVLDRVAPTTTSNAQALYTDVASIGLDATDAVSGVAATYWRLDGAPAEPYTGAISVSTEGQHVLQFYSVDRAGNTEDAPSVSFVIDRPNVSPPAPEIARLAGADRYATAAAVSKGAFGDWVGVTDVIVANGMDAFSADPLSAAGLAGAYRAPLILANGYLYSGKLVPSAETALAQIKAANGGSVRIHVVGGPVPIPTAVYNRLSALKGPSGTIERVYGADRYATSVAVANSLIARRGIANVPGALVANGQDPAAFYDALAASSSSYATGRPLLLTQRDSVPTSVSTILSGKLAGKPRIVVNASGYVSSTVLTRVGATQRMTSSTDRRVASVQIADYAASHGWIGRAHVGVANTLPDALSGGVALGEMGGPVIYTDATQLSASASTWLSQHKSEVRYVHVLGGTSVVGASTLGQIESAVD